MRTASRWLFLLVVLNLIACQFGDENKGSILIITVDSLSSQDVVCQDEPVDLNASGFQTLCQESIRFTHAYSTSPMAQSAISSLLTGVYADTHGVWHNGPQFVSANLETVAERALGRGYRTAFLSGGVPIWSKSGLRQGFEYFDDNIEVRRNYLYRPALDNFRAFLRWLDDTDSHLPFFAVQFLPDLQFENQSTVSDTGEIRRKSFEGQLEEIDESLAFLVKELKSRKRWNNTMVILAGLSGKSDFAYRGLLKPHNIYAENTQVALLIKPERKNPDRATNWKIDKNVSLSDVGHTLHKWLGGEPQTLPDGKLQPVEIDEALISPEVHWPEDRMILIASGWPAWRRWGEIQSSVRHGHFLTLLSEPAMTYNTLIDRMENIPQPRPDLNLLESLKEYAVRTPLLHPRPWTSIPKIMFQKMLLGHDLWAVDEITSELKTRLARLSGDDDPQIIGWMAYWALKSNDWVWLAELGTKVKSEIWTYVADRALNRQRSQPDKGCFSLLGKNRKEILATGLRACEDQTFLDLLLWVTLTEANSESEKYRESFLRDYEIHLADEKVEATNFINYMAWDTKSRALLGPSNYDLLLFLPENKVYHNIVKRRLSAKN